MSQRADGDETETLFSFELLVEAIRIERGSKASEELALGLRLLDFPTLLINQPAQRSRADGCLHGEGEHVFNRGKSCFFKMSLDSLHAQLSSSPLYAMVLDLKEEIPRLVGTSLISLATVMDKIRQDVTDRGASTPSSHGERGLVGISNLMGEKIGTISLSYKLLSLGASLLPHVTNSTGLISTCVHREHPLQGGITGRNTSAELSPPDKSDVSRNINKPVHGNTLIDEDKQGSRAGVVFQTELKARNQTPQNVQETENTLEEDLTVFCPPRLLYCNSSEERSKHLVDNSLTVDLEAFTFEDSEEEINDHRNEGTNSPVMNQEVRQSIKVSRSQETSGSAPNVLRENLQQLPLLNALLVELSQLNNQSPHQPMSIHPNLAWIYRPASTELENPAQKVQNKLPQTTRPSTTPSLKHLNPPRNCSTPLVRSPSVKVKDSRTSPRQTLVYGTTKTFNLRLKQNSSLKVKHRECVGLIQAGVPLNKPKRETKTSGKIMKSSKEKTAFKQRSGLNENIETMMQSQHTVTPALQETVTLKQKSLQNEEDRQSLRVSGTSSPSERGLKCIHIPSVNGDSVAPNKDEKELQSESDQSQSKSDRHSDNTESSGSSRRSSPRSSFSHSTSEGREEPDYADDFNSLEPSDTYSPDLASSPELSRAKTPRSPVRLDLHNSDSGSEGFQRRALHPAPIKALRSPQRALMGTHIIQPRTNASALSFSSDDGDRGGSASFQTICSRKQKRESGGVGRSSVTDSLTSSRGQRSDSAKNSSPLRGFSAESVSSFEPQEVEELEDELGSLDFRKEYQHISKLVASKLPGYTM